MSQVSPAERISLVVSALAFLGLSHLVLAEGLLIQILWLGVGLVLLRRLVLAAMPRQMIPRAQRVPAIAQDPSAQRRQQLLHPVRDYEFSN